MGATTLHVNSFQANAGYGSGTQVNDNATGTWVSGSSLQPIPTDNSVLNSIAQAGGCLYEGPTTITLTGTTMNVTSPNTPTGKPTGAPMGSVSNDALNAAANAGNVCMPASQGGSVSVPTDGVVYVEDCLNSATCTTTSPMAPTGSIDPGEEGVSAQNQNSVGDAIVQGSVTNPMTIGAANNIVIDGNLCYTDDVSGGTCTTSPTSPSTNVLGLVADNFVELSHPMAYTTSHGNETITGNAPTCSAGLGSGTTLCDLSNPIIDAVILALKRSFLVNYWDQGSVLGANCPVGGRELHHPQRVDRPGVARPGGHRVTKRVDRLRQELPVGLPPGVPVAAVLPEPGDLAVGLRLVHQRLGLVQDAHRPDLPHRVPVSGGPTRR